jgi:alpha,alpha-trehalose phosphorylase
VNVPDATIIKLYVDDEPLSLPTARVRDYARVLDMQAGILTRSSVGDGGRKARPGPLESAGLTRAPARDRHDVRSDALDHSAPVAISRRSSTARTLARSTRSWNGGGRTRGWRPCSRAGCSTRMSTRPRASILLGYQTTNSRMTLGVGVDHTVDAGVPTRRPCPSTTTPASSP